MRHPKTPTCHINTPFKRGTLKAACYTVLSNAGKAGLKVQDIVKQIQESKMAPLAGQTPANTICSSLSTVKEHFVKVAPGTYSLKLLQQGGEISQPMKTSGEKSALNKNRGIGIRNGKRPAQLQVATSGSIQCEDESEEEDLAGQGFPGTPGSSTAVGPMGVKRPWGQPSVTPSLTGSTCDPADGESMADIMSQKEACRQILSDAGPQGLLVGEVVGEIRSQKLASLVGKTPNNSITRCLSADDSFQRVGPGRYALREFQSAGTPDPSAGPSALPDPSSEPPDPSSAQMAAKVLSDLIGSQIGSHLSQETYSKATGVVVDSVTHHSLTKAHRPGSARGRGGGAGTAGGSLLDAGEVRSKRRMEELLPPDVVGPAAPDAEATPCSGRSKRTKQRGEGVSPGTPAVAEAAPAVLGRGRAHLRRPSAVLEEEDLPDPDDQDEGDEEEVEEEEEEEAGAEDDADMKVKAEEGLGEGEQYGSRSHLAELDDEDEAGVFHAVKIQEGLYQGRSKFAYDAAWLRAHGITHVVDCNPEWSGPAAAAVPDGVSCLEVPVTGAMKQQQAHDNWAAASEFVRVALGAGAASSGGGGRSKRWKGRGRRGRVLVHCADGGSASVSTLMAYACMVLRWKMQDVWKVVKEKYGRSVSLEQSTEEHLSQLQARRDKLPPQAPAAKRVTRSAALA